MTKQAGPFATPVLEQCLRILPPEGFGKMHEEMGILEQVNLAKESVQAADRLIGDYLPFVRSETAKFLKRPPREEDDELSIAMIAFHEAIGGYQPRRGSFLKYAALLIRSRLIDYERKERRHRGHLSLDAPQGEEEGPSLGDVIPQEGNDQEEAAHRIATRQEIEELSRQMGEFGVGLSDVADNCPKQERTISACRRAVEYAKENPWLLDELLETKRLPLGKLSDGSGVERKTLERHRKYLVALLLIYTNGYEIIRGHLAQVLKGGKAR